MGEHTEDEGKRMYVSGTQSIGPLTKLQALSLIQNFGFSFKLPA
jgi:hypothetical protein